MSALSCSRTRSSSSAARAIVSPCGPGPVSPSRTSCDPLCAPAQTAFVVGEVRGSEALDLLDAWATGHPGGCGTCHATTAEGALLRLDRLAQRNNVPSQAALIAEAVDLVAVVEGGNRGRRVADLARVAGVDASGRISLHHLTSDGSWQ